MSTDLYLDHNGSTPIDPRVAEVHARVLREVWGNASAAHGQGARARGWIERARASVAAGLGGEPDEIVFTSGGTESNAWALLGAAAARGNRGHLIVSAIEHKSVLRTAEHLERQGVAVTRVPVGRGGAVEADAVRRALRADTFLVSLMLANNETGVLQPVAPVAEACRERGVMLHCDAVAAIGKVPVDVRALGCDLLSLSAHKLYAPKGCGVLWLRRGVELPPLIHGCGQQRGARSGTENTAGAAAFGLAFERLRQGAFHGRVPIRELRDALWRGIAERFPQAQRNGSGELLPNTLSVAFPGRRGADLQRALAEAGIDVAAGAAASNGEPSHVLVAMGLDPERAASTLRFSLGAGSVPATVETTLAALERVVPHGACLADGVKP